MGGTKWSPSHQISQCLGCSEDFNLRYPDLHKVVCGCLLWRWGASPLGACYRGRRAERHVLPCHQPRSAAGGPVCAPRHSLYRADLGLLPEEVVVSDLLSVASRRQVENTQGMAIRSTPFDVIISWDNGDDL